MRFPPKRFLGGTVLCVLALFVGSLSRAETPARAVARPAVEWFRSGVIYEVNPRTFSPTRDLNGITAQIDRLQQLGVTVLWLMPIHPIGVAKKKGSVGSPYAVRDYYAIDSSYGTAADLKRLVSEAHRRGMKVILDVVLNHTSWDCVLMKYPEFYKHDAAGHIIPPNPDWQDVAGLDYSNPKLRRYMADVLSYWLRDFDLDGFRCDVAAGPPTDFWEQARAELDRIKPGIGMLAEASQPDLLGKAFDADYAWPFHTALTDTFENGKPAANIRAVWEKEREEFPRGALHMRFSDNHDEKRAIARFGERGALAASALVFTLDGVPMLYNGMEVGDTTESGAPALFEPLLVFWQFVERRPEFPLFYQKIISLRREHAALQQGETAWVDNSAPGGLLSFIRRGVGEEFLVLINTTNRPIAGRVKVLSAAGYSEVPLPPGKASGVPLPSFRLDAWGFRVYQRAPRH